MTYQITKKRNYFDDYINGALLDWWGFSRDVYHNEYLWEEKDGSASLTISAPGIKRENFKVELNKDILSVELSGVEKDSLAARVGVKNFRKEWKVPREFNVEKIKAKYDAGILTIKLERAPPKTIPVKTVEVE